MVSFMCRVCLKLRLCFIKENVLMHQAYILLVYCHVYILVFFHVFVYSLLF